MTLAEFIMCLKSEEVPDDTKVYLRHTDEIGSYEPVVCFEQRGKTWRIFLEDAE